MFKFIFSTGLIFLSLGAEASLKPTCVIQKFLPSMPPGTGPETEQPAPVAIEVAISRLGLAQVPTPVEIYGRKFSASFTEADSSLSLTVDNTTFVSDRMQQPNPVRIYLSEPNAEDSEIRFQCWFE